MGILDSDVRIFAADTLPVLAELDERDATLWILPAFLKDAGAEATAKLAGLPWELVLDDTSDLGLLSEIEALPRDLDSLLVRRRGLTYLVEGSPSSVRLPPRSLPIFLLRGRGTGADQGFAARARRMEAVAELPRREVSNLVVLGGPDLELPKELGELWADGFRSRLTIVSDDPDASAKIQAWQAEARASSIALIPAKAESFARALPERFLSKDEGRLVIRIRDARGERHEIDLTGQDDPEAPLLANYELLTVADLAPMAPEVLSEADVNGFFEDPAASWRPYAAGMPWQRDRHARSTLLHALGMLDRKGPEANGLFYVRAESGAGATTFVRDLAFYAAIEGYPTLVATRAPFAPNGRRMERFITTCLKTLEEAALGGSSNPYEVPWLIVFDRSHWDGQERDLGTFASQIAAAGRRVCILLVTDALLPMAFHSERRLVELCTLSHEIDQSDALALGEHLNKFLRPKGSARSVNEWTSFLETSLVVPGLGRSVFWIALAFWLRRQIDMNVTLQGWLYARFTEGVLDKTCRRAIVDIAAMSSVRKRLPEALLPHSTDFPTRDKLGDLQSVIGALGATRERDGTINHWAMIHAELGRYLLIELFHDSAAAEAMGLSGMQDPDSLRLEVLAKIAADPRIAHPDLRPLAEAFATSVFKIDPGQGHSQFAQEWRAALSALDAMPETVRLTSRSFLHHSAVSRRRIAKDEGLFPLDVDERATLLTRAAADIERALTIEAEPGGETDLNLLNSLAHAYHDLAAVEEARGAAPNFVASLRIKAHRATGRAYALNPDNSFVIELYARDRIEGAEADPDGAASVALEVLGIVYGAMAREAAGARRNALSALADRAFELMIRTMGDLSDTEPRDAGEAIAKAIAALTRNVDPRKGMTLEDFPRDNRIASAERLGHEILRNNPQAVRLRYVLTRLDQPKDLAFQLELLQALDGTNTVLTPQLRLELAILEHQNGRHHEASRRFLGLRRLWREGAHFVEVPSHLQWLVDPATGQRREVRARIASGSDGARGFANVQELGGERIPYRPGEVDDRVFRLGAMISGRVSFGHNGPLLRPLTAR
jgi:hypothetical protein